MALEPVCAWLERVQQKTLGTATSCGKAPSGERVSVNANIAEADCLKHPPFFRLTLQTTQVQRCIYMSRAIRGKQKNAAARFSLGGSLMGG